MKQRFLLMAAALLLSAALAFAQADSVTLTIPLGTGGGAVTSLQVQRGTVSGGPYATIGSVPVVAGTTTYTYVDTASLVEGATYYYVVEAIGPGGTSAPSTQVSATVPFQPPAVPGPVTVVVK